ncbi:MAG: OmpH family outer membrane protein [Planctomycetes bacterium]|nr:OmpH family outer membrane protein [Planctomycetota bacterium]
MTSRINGFHFLLGVLALSAALVWSSSRGESAQADAAFRIAPDKVAVVDIERITNDFLDAKGDLDELNEKYARNRRSLEEMQRQLRSMQEEAQVYPSTDPRRLEAETQIAVKAGELKVQSESMKESESREKAKLTAEVYEKARQTIADYAREKGLQLVLLRQSGTLKGLRMEDVSSNILVRSVIWNRDDLDITQEILDRMK